jgi:hypothetical protein
MTQDNRSLDRYLKTGPHEYGGEVATPRPVLLNEPVTWSQSSLISDLACALYVDYCSLSLCLNHTTVDNVEEIRSRQL